MDSDIDKRIREYMIWYREHSYYLRKPGADLEKSNEFLHKAFLGCLELLAMMNNEIKGKNELILPTGVQISGDIRKIG